MYLPGYYTYAYLRKDGTPYYIGKGSTDRAWTQHRKNGKGIQTPKDRNRIVILECNLTEFGALALERRMIRWYGRKDLGTGILRNCTDGGDGSGWSDAAKLKVSLANKGRVAHNKGKVIPREIKELANPKKKSRGIGPHSGKQFSEETKAKMSAARKGKPLSAETRARMSESRKRLFDVIKSIN